MKSWIIPFIIILAITSCATQEVCDSENQSILAARFKSVATGEITDTVVAGISIYGIRDGKSDSLLYNLSSEAGIELPLDPSSDRSRFVMTVAEKSDTLIIKHSSEAYLISYSCGFAARFILENITTSGGIITDTELISATVDAEQESDETHLWIYF